jgi:uncharacterized RDD family membrane protein YckC
VTRVIAMTDRAWARLIAVAGIVLMLCLAVVPLIFDAGYAAVPMICVTAAFGMAVLCRLVFEGVRSGRQG